MCFLIIRIYVFIEQGVSVKRDIRFSKFDVSISHSVTSYHIDIAGFLLQLYSWDSKHTPTKIS
jgi:hypothetical protein